MKPITGQGREKRRDDVIAIISGAIPRNVGRLSYETTEIYSRRHALRCIWYTFFSKQDKYLARNCSAGF